MASTITLSVTRWRPDRSMPPGPQEYEVPLRKEWTVLDGLNHIKNEIDQTLAFRWSCRMGICGSCGMNVNGEPRLTCGAFLSDYAPGPIRVEPLANFPIARDLIVDMSDFMEKLPRVKPWVIRDDDVTEIDGEYLQTPEELDAYKQFSMCINCMLCYAACPVYGLDPHGTRRVVVEKRGTGQPGFAVDVHPAAAADAHPARPPEGQCRVELVLHVVEPVEDGQLLAQRYVVLLPARLSVLVRPVPRHPQADAVRHPYLP